MRQLKLKQSNTQQNLIMATLSCNFMSTFPSQIMCSACARITSCDSVWNVSSLPCGHFEFVFQQFFHSVKQTGTHDGKHFLFDSIFLLFFTQFKHCLSKHFGIWALCWRKLHATTDGDACSVSAHKKLSLRHHVNRTQKCTSMLRLMSSISMKQVACAFFVLRTCFFLPALIKRPTRCQS